MEEQRKLGNLIIRDRNFKMGEVFRWVPSYASLEDIKKRAREAIAHFRPFENACSRMPTYGP